MQKIRTENIEGVAQKGGYTLCSVGTFNAGDMGKAPICANCKHSSLPLQRLCNAILDNVTGKPIPCDSARGADDACGPLAKLFEHRNPSCTPAEQY